MDQDYIPGEASKNTSIRSQLLATLRERGASAGTIPMSVASRIDKAAYPGKRIDLDGITLWVKL